METVCQFVSNMPADITLAEFCKGVTDAVLNIYTGHNLDICHLRSTPVERTTASAVIYSNYHRQVWLVGDCHCTVNGRYYDNPKPQEETIAARRSAFIKNELKRGKSISDFQTNDTGRAYILKDLIASCSQQNIGYAVIDGFDIPLDKVRIIEVKPDDTEIILASDGYPFIKETLQKSEDALSRLIGTDPLLINDYKATKGVMKGCKSFDDRSYIRFNI